MDYLGIGRCLKRLLGIICKGEGENMKEKTFTREKMMKDKNYVPYCGNDLCYEMPRMIRNHNNSQNKRH